MKRRHDLKTWPAPFEAMWNHNKTHEIRKNDRGFSVGDYLLLREYDPRDGGYAAGKYTGRAILARVAYVSEGGTWGLPADLCVLSIHQQSRTEDYTIGQFDAGLRAEEGRNAP